MAKTDVSPPPINVPVVNVNTGLPTRALSDFLYKLWERTGGNDNQIASALSLALTGSGSPAVGGGGQAAESDSTAKIIALLETIATRQAGEIAALREQVNSLAAAAPFQNQGLAAEAKEDADVTQSLMFAMALGRTPPGP